MEEVHGAAASGDMEKIVSLINEGRLWSEEVPLALWEPSISHVRKVVEQSGMHWATRGSRGSLKTCCSTGGEGGSE